MTWTCLICQRLVLGATRLGGKPIVLDAEPQPGGNVRLDSDGVARFVGVTGHALYRAHRHRAIVSCVCGGSWESVSFGIAVEKFRAHRCTA